MKSNGRHTILVTAMLCAGGALLSQPVQARDLSLQERVRAQEAIERVYYSHQIGVTRPFAEAVPAAVLRKKVDSYLEQSTTLEHSWKTPITAAMLRAEVDRMIRQSRMPDRLREIFAALGDDPLIIEECLARPALSERLSQNFERSRPPGAMGKPMSPEVPRGQTAPAGERLEAPRSIGFDPHSVKAVSTGTPTPALAAFLDSPGTESCLPDDTWDNGSLDDAPDIRRNHTAVWTGSLMVIWGGYPNAGEQGFRYSTGARYDPATDTWTPTSRVNTPSARSGHSAVWAAGRMIVWGSDGGDSSGGRYDPATDTWAPTSLMGAPASRIAPSVVSTGSQMIVWGGLQVGALDTGGRYDPASDTWLPTSTTGAPSARYNHSAVWTGTQMLIWGGTGGGSGGRYDPGSDTWTPISGTGSPGAGPAVWTGSLMLVFQDDGVDAGGRYNPASDSWSPINRTGAPLLSRFEASWTWTGSEMTMWGGVDPSTNNLLNTGGKYNPASDSWSATSLVGAPAGRYAHTAVWTGSMLLVWGGAGDENAGGGDVVAGGRYQPASDAWTPMSTGNGPSYRGSHSAVWTGSLMIVWGGFDIDCTATGARYDPALDTWSATSGIGAPSPRGGHTAVWTGERMVVWGGNSCPGALGTGGRYDPVADSWADTSGLGAPSPRRSHTAVWTGTEMVIWGGSVDSVGRLNTGGRYNPTSDSWIPTSPAGAPLARFGHVAVWTGSEMLIWGGDVATGALKTGGRYSPAGDSWAPTSTANAPNPGFYRWRSTAVWTGNRMIVWGHNSGNAAYDPVLDTWTPIAVPSCCTVTTEGHTAIWTGSRMIIWGGGVLDDWGVPLYDMGGVYDPGSNSWTPTSTTDAASFRAGHTAIWTGRFMIVWGGWSGSFSSLLGSGGRYIYGQSIDDDGDGISECGGDCADGNPSIHPGAAEVCNGLDDNCSLSVDEGGGTLCADADACTTDLCAGISGCQHPIRDLDGDAHPDAACGGNDCADADAFIWMAPAAVTNLGLSTANPANPSWDSQAASSGPGTLYDLASGTMGPSAGALNFTLASCLQSSSSPTYSDSRTGPPSGTAFWYLARGRNACGTGTYGSAARDTGIPSCP